MFYQFSGFTKHKSKQITHTPSFESTSMATLLFVAEPEARSKSKANTFLKEKQTNLIRNKTRALNSPGEGGNVYTWILPSN